MKKNRVQLLLLSTAAALGSFGTAHAAAGTTAGTSIENEATVDYEVSGTPQTTKSNKSTFVVDLKANLLLVRDQTEFTTVTAGQANAVVKFKLTNLTNGTQDFLIDADQLALSLGILTGNDDFDAAQLRFFVDTDRDGNFDITQDTATYVDELGPDASRAIFIVGNIPAAANQHNAFVGLHATIAEGGATGVKGAALTQTVSLANADNTVDVVFADDDNDGAGLDTVRNGQARAYGGYQLEASGGNLTVSKTARVVNDEVNGILNPKSLPGSEVEYCFVIRNTSLLTPATKLTLTDVIPPNTTYVPGSISMGNVALLNACLLNALPEDDDANDTDETDGYTASFTGNTVTMKIPSIAGSGAYAASFRVKIN